MKAIIVAAGMGRRLAPYTDDRPKCLVEVNGRAILDRQLDAYRACGGPPHDERGRSRRRDRDRQKRDLVGRDGRPLEEPHDERGRRP